MNPEIDTHGDLAIVAHLLAASAEPSVPLSAYGDWKRSWQRLAPAWRRPLDRALALGLAADRPAWAFAAGYQAAIQAMFATRGQAAALGAVCISERGGPHPARIRTRLRSEPGARGRWRLDGEKSFVTGAAAADRLYVAASAGRRPDGGKDIRLAVVDAAAAGVRVEPRPALEFVPELPHGRVRFEAVALTDDDLLQDDGYGQFVKPFRTVEDLHVTAAFLAWVFGLGRRAGWPRERLARLLNLMVAARALAQAPPSGPALHIALGGFLAEARPLLAGDGELWGAVAGEARARWRRDRAVLAIAATARERRLELAWRRYGL